MRLTTAALITAAAAATLSGASPLPATAHASVKVRAAQQVDTVPSKLDAAHEARHVAGRKAQPDAQSKHVLQGPEQGFEEHSILKRGVRETLDYVRDLSANGYRGFMSFTGLGATLKSLQISLEPRVKLLKSTVKAMKPAPIYIKKPWVKVKKEEWEPIPGAKILQPNGRFVAPRFSDAYADINLDEVGKVRTKRVTLDP